MVSALWIDLSVWLIILAAMTPWLSLLPLSRKASPRLLHLHPQKDWLFFTQTQRHGEPVGLIQSWQHYFGVTLSLKLLNCPHNKQDTVRMTVWRCTLPPEQYRRMCVMVAWQLDQPQAQHKLETV